MLVSMLSVRAVTMNRYQSPLTLMLTRYLTPAAVTMSQYQLPLTLTLSRYLTPISWYLYRVIQVVRRLAV